MWFDTTAKLDYDSRHHRLDVAVPNRFVADWIGKHFQSQLIDAANEETGETVDLRVNIQPDLFPGEARIGAATPPARHGRSDDHAAAAERDAAADHRGPAGVVTPRLGKADTDSPAAPLVPTPPLRPHQHSTFHSPMLRHVLDNFIVGPTNELAFTTVRAVCEEEQTRANPVFIHGGCGLGKTHLLHGVCNHFRDRKPSARIHYTTGEQFTNDFVAALRANKLDAFRKQIRKLDLLAVDDVHFLANKTQTQQEFLHSFDAIDLGGARVILASDSHPKLIQQFSSALISRCIRGMVVEVRPPDAVMRAALVRALAQRRGIKLLDSVVDLLASRAVGSVREIEGMLTKLHALAMLDSQHRQTTALDDTANQMAGATLDQPIGHTIANRLFQDDFPRHPRHTVSFETILGVVASETGVSRAQIMASNRHTNTVLARSLCVHLARKMTPMSFPEIAAALGRKNHSTVITASQRVERQLTANETILQPGSMTPTPLDELVQRLRLAILRA